MKSVVLIALSIVVSISPLHARLGDTERECITRYGSAVRQAHSAILGPLIPGSQQLSFKYQGWNIRVAFVGGRVAAQDYRKDSSVLKTMVISEDEVKAILQGESGGTVWESAKPKRKGDLFNQLAQELMGPMADGRLWLRSDGARAHIDHSRFRFTFTTPAATAAKDAETARKQTEDRSSIPKF
jgi:hypothetical protein